MELVVVGGIVFIFVRCSHTNPSVVDEVVIFIVIIIYAAVVFFHYVAFVLLSLNIASCVVVAPVLLLLWHCCFYYSSVSLFITICFELDRGEGEIDYVRRIVFYVLKVDSITKELGKYYIINIQTKPSKSI